MEQCQDILVGCSICRNSRRQRMRFATLLWSLVGRVGFWMRMMIWLRVLWR